jgi:hypothetical protein
MKIDKHFLFVFDISRDIILNFNPLTLYIVKIVDMIQIQMYLYKVKIIKSSFCNSNLKCLIKKILNARYVIENTPTNKSLIFVLVLMAIEEFK